MLCERPSSLTRRTFLAALGLLCGCPTPFGSSHDAETFIRLQNTSAYEMHDVTFSSGHPAHTFESIPPGAATEYYEVPQSYSYGFLEVHVDGQRYVMQPIDYVGEEHIRPGRYTFRISFNAGSGTLGLQLERN